MAKDFEERLRDLRRDCGDGQDLTTAMTLIGDAVQRRISRMRRSLAEIKDDAPKDGETELDRAVDQLRGLVDRYESSLRQHHDHWKESMQDFEDQLDAQADRLQLD